MGQELAGLHSSHALLQAQHAGLQSLQASLASLARSPGPSNSPAEASAGAGSADVHLTQSEPQQLLQQHHPQQDACDQSGGQDAAALASASSSSHQTKAPAADGDAPRPGPKGTGLAASNTNVAVSTSSIPEEASEPAAPPIAKSGKGTASSKGDKEGQGRASLAENAVGPAQEHEAGNSSANSQHASSSRDQTGSGKLNPKESHQRRQPPVGKSNSPQQGPKSRMRQLQADRTHAQPASPTLSCNDSARSTVCVPICLCFQSNDQCEDIVVSCDSATSHVAWHEHLLNRSKARRPCKALKSVSSHTNAHSGWNICHYRATGLNEAAGPS